MTGWVKRRSTRTTTVLSCLSLTTTPCSMRFGISRLLRLGFRACGAFAPCCFVLTRGRRVVAALRRRRGLEPSEVAANRRCRRSVLELACRPREAPVESRLLTPGRLVDELIDPHVREITGRRGHSAPGLVRDAVGDGRL